MTQKLVDILKQFDLQINLTDAILSIEVPGEFDSYTLEPDNILRFVNSEKGFLDYGKFKAYVFKTDDVYVCLAPDNNYEHLTILTKLEGSNRFVGCSYDAWGIVSVRT